MKKIVAINCSPRSAWNTATLVREAAKGAGGKGAEVEMIDPEHKKQRHETVFPADMQKAFALGEQMVSRPW